jgi:hypothetical protein
MLQAANMLVPYTLRQVSVEDLVSTAYYAVFGRKISDAALAEDVARLSAGEPLPRYWDQYVALHQL